MTSCKYRGRRLEKQMFDKSYVSKRDPIFFEKHIKIISHSAVGGKKEKSGPLGDCLDIYCDDEKLSCSTWENAESEMCRMALDIALSKADLRETAVDYLIAGDLMNQCTGAGYGLLSFDIPYFGLYGACSTFAEGITLGGIMIEAGAAECVAVVVSSHFCTAERQYRYPLEYGSFSETTAQTTVTGAGCVILSSSDRNESGAYITSAMPGIVCDSGIKDAANMGAAMCTAASDTIIRYFKKIGNDASVYDLVATGDLGKEGFSIAREMMAGRIKNIEKVYNDCGIMIYDTQKQDVGAGGSGCGCSAVVTSGHIIKQLEDRKMKKAIVVGTGAMMSPQSLLQGQSIPSVGHLVELEGR